MNVRFSCLRRKEKTMQTKEMLTSMIADQMITRRTLAGDLPTVGYTEEGVVLFADPLNESTTDSSILDLIDSDDEFEYLSRNTWICLYPKTEDSVVDDWNDWITSQYLDYGIMSSIVTGLQPYLLYENDMFRLVEDKFDTGWCNSIEEAKNKWNSIMTPLYSEKLLPGDYGFPKIELKCHTVYKNSESWIPEYFSIRGVLKGLPRGKYSCDTLDEAIQGWNELVDLVYKITV